MISTMFPDCMPFIASFAMMVTLGVLELLALLIGFSATERAGGLLVSHFGLDHAGAPAEMSVAAHCLSWLHVGRVPLLVIFTLLLLGFSLTGFSLQYASVAAFGATLGPVVSVPIAAFISLCFTRSVGGLVARLVPSIESAAISEAEFVGAVATIVGADAKKSDPGQARFIDRFGQLHYVRVEPRTRGECLRSGARVVIVERISESLYLAAAI